MTDAIAEAKISRQLYYRLEARALNAMVRALSPAASGDDKASAGGIKRAQELEAKVDRLERERRRSDRLLLLTRKMIMPGSLKVAPGRPKPSWEEADELFEDTFKNLDRLTEGLDLTNVRAPFDPTEGWRGRALSWDRKLEPTPPSTLGTWLAGDRGRLSRGRLVPIVQPNFAPRPIDIYRRLLDENVRVELIDGEVVVHAAPGMLHGFGASGVGSDLYQAYQRGRGGPGGWWILDEVDVYLEETTQAYRPDIAGWRRERVPRIPQERPISVVPDFVCEVLSDTNARWDLGPKRDGYRRAGVRWYSILDPQNRRLDANELIDGEYRHVGSVTADEPGSLPPFDAVRLVMSEIFPIDG